MTLLRSPAPALLALLLAASCDRASPWTPYPGMSLESMENTDVVESRLDENPSEGLGVENGPELSIGVVDGDARYQFSDIAGVLRFDEGSVLVADRASKELRLYSADGRHQRTAGGPGSGLR